MQRSLLSCFHLYTLTVALSAPALNFNVQGSDSSWPTTISTCLYYAKDAATKTSTLLQKRPWLTSAAVAVGGLWGIAALTYALKHETVKNTAANNGDPIIDTTFIIQNIPVHVYAPVPDEPVDETEAGSRPASSRNSFTSSTDGRSSTMSNGSFSTSSRSRKKTNRKRRGKTREVYDNETRSDRGLHPFIAIPQPANQGPGTDGLTILSAVFPHYSGPNRTRPTQEHPQNNGTGLAITDQPKTRLILDNDDDYVEQAVKEAEEENNRRRAAGDEAWRKKMKIAEPSSTRGTTTVAQ